MNVPNQFQQIGIFLAQNGLIAILKKMSPAVVTSVVADHITGQQSSHQFSDRRIARSKQEVGMVIEQCPGKTAGIRLFYQVTQTAKKIGAILFVFKNTLSIDPSDDNMMKSTWRIDSGFTWHRF